MTALFCSCAESSIRRAEQGHFLERSQELQGSDASSWSGVLQKGGQPGHFRHSEGKPPNNGSFLGVRKPSSNRCPARRFSRITASTAAGPNRKCGRKAAKLPRLAFPHQLLFPRIKWLQMRRQGGEGLGHPLQEAQERSYLWLRVELSRIGFSRALVDVHLVPSHRFWERRAFLCQEVGHPTRERERRKMPAVASLSMKSSTNTMLDKNSSEMC